MCTPESEFPIPCYSRILLSAKLWKILIQNAVMNDEEKLFQQKQSLETLFLLMKKTRAKKFKVRMFYHLQNLFWGVLSGGFWLGGFFGGGLCPGVFCPEYHLVRYDIQIQQLLLTCGLDNLLPMRKYSENRHFGF